MQARKKVILLRWLKTSKIIIKNSNKKKTAAVKKKIST